MQMEKRMSYCSCLLTWPEPQTLTPPVSEDVERQELPFIAGENGSAALEDSLSVSNKSKHTPTVPWSACTPFYLPKEAEKACSRKKPARGCLWQLYA